MDYKSIIEKAEQIVRNIIQKHHDPNLFYHNIIHTENVVNSVNKVAEHYLLSSREHFICCIAAWFHDIGYFEGPEGHEQRGAKRAREFLINNDVDEETTTTVENCILATRIPQKPANLLEEILCDADLYHLGTSGFTAQNKLVHKETEAIHNIQISKEQWRNDTIRLIENHHYHTEFCRKLLGKKKKRNLEKLKKRGLLHFSSIDPKDVLVQAL